MHLAHFVDFDPATVPMPVMQQKYPPLYSLHTAIQNSMGGQHQQGQGNGGQQQQLDFSDACKMLILNNIEGLTSKMMMELHTSSKLNRDTRTVCAGV